jgi:hypothetical protein
MQWLPFVKLALGINHIIVESRLSIILDHFHQNFSYKSQDWSSSLVVRWTHDDVMNNQMSRTQTSYSPTSFQFSQFVTRTSSYCSSCPIHEDLNYEKINVSLIQNHPLHNFEILFSGHLLEILLIDHVFEILHLYIIFFNLPIAHLSLTYHWIS